ncbi:MAG: hypothetical protein LBV49_08130, partial [Azonexus sp.]|nr:hypothetical protein [Azonexus sp.]
SVVGDFAALTANEIGSAWGNPNAPETRNPFLQTLAHGALGATAATLTGKDAVAGAIGGVTESLLDNTLQQSDWKIENGLGYTVTAMLVSEMIAEATGKDAVTAAGAAQNAAVNNSLTPKQGKEYADCVAQKGMAACTDIKARLDAINRITNEQIERACNGGQPEINCQAALRSAYDFLSDPLFRAPGTSGLFADYLQTTQAAFAPYQDKYRAPIPTPLAQAELDHPNVFGGIKLLGGVAGVAGGVAACMVGSLVCIPGGLGVLYSTDVGFSGINQIATQTPQQTYYQGFLLNDLGLDPRDAMAADMMTGFVLTAGTTAVAVSKAGAVNGATGGATSTIQANKAAGSAFELQVKGQLQQTQFGVVEQVTVKTQSGVKTRIDLIGRDAAGNIVCTECKASLTAPLTKNQAAAFPEIKQSGAIVVGQGKPGFPGGTQIPPTKVDIIRP